MIIVWNPILDNSVNIITLYLPILLLQSGGGGGRTILTTIGLGRTGGFPLPPGGCLSEPPRFILCLHKKFHRRFMNYIMGKDDELLCKDEVP